MTRVPTALAAAVLLTIGAGASSARAQTQLFRSANAQTGKVARLFVMAALKKDCTPGSIGEIRVVTPPKNGTLAIKKGKLKTPAGFRCPNVETEAQAVFYESNPKFTGSDEISIQTKNADGAVEATTIRITVADKPAQAPAPDKKESLEL